MVELGLLAGFLLILGFIGLIHEAWERIRARHEQVAKMRIMARKAKEPRRKEREDYWAA